MRKKILFVIMCLVTISLVQPVHAQKKEKIEGVIFKFVDSDPEFVGGREAMITFLNDNMVFPKKATKRGTKKGKVYLEFIVKANGDLANIKVSKSSDKVFEKEAVRLFTIMPTWKPGILNGNNVNSRYVFPIKFGYDSVLENK